MQWGNTEEFNGIIMAVLLRTQGGIRAKVKVRKLIRTQLKNNPIWSRMMAVGKVKSGQNLDIR